jgi:hypothetical protein
MKGFKQYLFSEIRHAMLSKPIKLNISQPVNGHFETSVKDVKMLDMKYEFYLGPKSTEMMHRKFIQQFPEHVRTKDNQVLISEGYDSMRSRFFAAEVDEELLHRALLEKRAYYDTSTRKLVATKDNATTIECEVNPLDQYRITPDELWDHELQVSAIRDGWEQLKVFHWWDFVLCIGSDNSIVKKSCRYDTNELTKATVAA